MLSSADGTVTVRRSLEDDALGLRELADLDSARVPAGVMLIAEVDGELRAAVALDGRSVIADPPHHTRHLVDLLGVARREEATRAPTARAWRPGVLVPTLVRRSTWATGPASPDDGFATDACSQGRRRRAPGRTGAQQGRRFSEGLRVHPPTHLHKHDLKARALSDVDARARRRAADPIGSISLLS